METINSKLAETATIYLRLALAAAYLASVASRFGLFGEGVSWGNFQNFLAYTAKVIPFLPASFIPTVGWIATLAEIILGVMLLVGFRIKEAAFLSGVMLILFAIGMTLGFNAIEPLSYSVYSASAASFLLAVYHKSSFSLDAFIGKSIEMNS
ncbi:MAG: DoxX protein [Pyrinomonadaceae bacterium]|nr:DoxX protein [Pyrinomonadaceae bacterium]